MKFLDSLFVWLCNECIQTAREFGVHQKDWVYCSNCKPDHHYSLIEMTVNIGDCNFVLYTPVPIVEKWKITAKPNGAQSKQNNKKKIHYKINVMKNMPQWLKASSREHRGYGRGHYDDYASETLLKSYPATAAKERLEAAYKNLREALRQE